MVILISRIPVAILPLHDHVMSTSFYNNNIFCCLMPIRVLLKNYSDTADTFGLKACRQDACLQHRGTRIAHSLSKFNPL